MIITEIDKARFWSKVKVKMTNNPAKSCWTWTGRKHKGYGQFTINGKCQYATRISWYIFNGDPESLGVLHICDNPSCVNPFHLFIGNQKVNMRDCNNKGRCHRGERTGGAILTEENVKAIRKLYVKGKIGPKRISKQLGLSFFAVTGVIHGGNWKHIR